MRQINYLVCWYHKERRTYNPKPKNPGPARDFTARMFEEDLSKRLHEYQCNLKQTLRLFLMEARFFTCWLSHCISSASTIFAVALRVRPNWVVELLPKLTFVTFAQPQPTAVNESYLSFVVVVAQLGVPILLQGWPGFVLGGWAWVSRLVAGMYINVIIRNQVQDTDGIKTHPLPELLLHPTGVHL